MLFRSSFLFFFLSFFSTFLSAFSVLQFVLSPPPPTPPIELPPHLRLHHPHLPLPPVLLVVIRPRQIVLLNHRRCHPNQCQLRRLFLHQRWHCQSRKQRHALRLRHQCRIGGFGLRLRFENGLRRSKDPRGPAKSWQSHLGAARPNGGVTGLVFVGRKGWREVSIQPNAEKNKNKERERERERERESY